VIRRRDFDSQRARMVERQLRRRGISDEQVLESMAAVPREQYVPDAERPRAYVDGALPIGFGQTISQPWIVAAIAAALRLDGSERVLEVGAGMGYSTAVLARLCTEVTAIERIGELAGAAAQRLAEQGVKNARVVHADGSVGLPGAAPFGAIAVHAAAPGPPPSLLDQLAVGAHLVVPITSPGVDTLTVYRRTGTLTSDAERGVGVEVEVIGPCRFVPLLGEEGFPSA